MMPVLDAPATAAVLGWRELAAEVEQLLLDDAARVPPRTVQPLPGGASLFLMPAHDARLAIVKLITFTPANAGTPRPAIQGDVVVFDAASGERVLLLDGPTVTARRTAAVSLLAAQRLASCPQGPLLIVGAGVQGRAHLEAFAAGLPLAEVRIASRGAAAAQALAAHAGTLGLRAGVVADADAALPDCPLVVTATPARAPLLRGDALRDDAFVCAVGAFTPEMAELAAPLVQRIARDGDIVVDSADARHEAGDLLQAGIDAARCATLADIVRGARAAARQAPCLFKSCGWAGWDLAAARLARRTATQGR